MPVKESLNFSQEAELEKTHFNKVADLLFKFHFALKSNPHISDSWLKL